MLLLPPAHESCVECAPATLARGAPIPTWFGVGGLADTLERVHSVQQLRAAMARDPGLLMLGDGANLLVADEGVGSAVVQLAGAFEDVSIDGATGRVVAGAAADLPKLIRACVRAGLAGIEGLTGVPARLGGAIAMNAGGRHGEIASAVRRVELLGRDGRVEVVERDAMGFGYRRSAVGGRIVLGVELALTPGDPAALLQRAKDVMHEKKRTQPLAARCAGCVFRNPTLLRDVEGIGAAGQSVGAGLLIDRAGLKGTRIGSAEISAVHANFFAAEAGGRASDVLALIALAQRAVRDRFGVELVREVVVWGREGVAR